MYEAEVNRVLARADKLPQAVLDRFVESGSQVLARTVLPWGEHCTECNIPTCYTTCELYEPREDGACRLFVNGMVRIDHPGCFNGYLLEIRFKRWGKLWTVGNLQLLPPVDALARERSNLWTGALARSIPLPFGIKGRVLRKVSYFRRRDAEAAIASAETPDCFLLECYNPNDRVINLTFTVRTLGGDMSAAFQQILSMAPGFTTARISVAEIIRRVDLKRPFEVEIVPNDCEDIVLYFGALDFVKERLASKPSRNGSASRPWKCIVWDLDNTLWDGILVEDGVEKLRIRQSVVDVIKETDQRGILHSIASKNNHDEAMKLLRMCGLEEYFLYPQISWQPKSQSIERIVQLLNIGADSVAFVDDQAFERGEVKAALPDVTVVDALEAAEIPSRAECQVPVTDESRQRRSMYRQQQQRETSLQSHVGGYHAFLRDCNIQLAIMPLAHGNLERVYELAQRTNQMNFSGNRYPLVQLKEMMASSLHETFVMRCADKFGSYGIVGFAVIDLQGPRLLDLMFSCRIQSKRVEHAFLTSLLKRFVLGEQKDFYANYRPTPKNAACGKVFEELGFQRVDEKDGIVSLVFKADRVIPDETIVRICKVAAD